MVSLAPPYTLGYIRPGLEYRRSNGFTLGGFVDLQAAYKDYFGAGLYTGFAF